MSSRAPGDTALEMEDHSAFLSGPPRSGELSPFAQMIAAQAFIWLASIVVFGSTADFAVKHKDFCLHQCRFNIAAGVLSFFGMSFLLTGHYLTLSNNMAKGSWFSSRAETRYMIVLVFWWTVGASCLSAFVDVRGIPASQTTKLATMFGWLAFFGSIFGAYKAYHSEQEEKRSLRYAQIVSLQATEEEEYANFS